MATGIQKTGRQNGRRAASNLRLPVVVSYDRDDEGMLVPRRLTVTATLEPGISARDAEIVAEHVSGELQKQIADHHGITQQHVSRILRGIRSGKA